MEHKIESFKRRGSRGAGRVLFLALGLAATAMAEPWLQLDLPGDAQAQRLVPAEAGWVYVIGTHSDGDAGGNRLRVEKRSLSGAALNPSFNGGAGLDLDPAAMQGALRGAVRVGGQLYLAVSEKEDGLQGEMIALDGSSGAALSDFGTAGRLSLHDGSRVLWGMDSDGTALYALGGTQGSGDAQWKIEKRSLADGALVTGFASGGVLMVDQADGTDAARTMAVAGNDLIFGGERGNSGTDLAVGILERRRADDGSLVSSFGTAGRVSINAQSRVEQLICDGTRLFSAGRQDSGYTHPRLTVTRHDGASGALSPGFGTYGHVFRHSTEKSLTGGIALDGESLAIAFAYDGVQRLDLGWSVHQISALSGLPNLGFAQGGAQDTNPSDEDDLNGPPLILGNELYVPGSDRTNGAARWIVERLSLALVATPTPIPTLEVAAFCLTPAAKVDFFDEESNFDPANDMEWHAGRVFTLNGGYDQIAVRDQDGSILSRFYISEDYGDTYSPKDLAIGNGMIYVADGNAIKTYTLEGVFLSMLGSGVGAELPNTEWLRWIQTAPDGSLWINRDQQMDHLSPLGSLLGSWPLGFYAAGLEVDSQRVYLINRDAHAVQAYSHAGALLWTVGGQGTAPGQLDGPNDLSLSQGLLYVTDEGNGRINAYRDSDGQFMGSIGQRSMGEPEAIDDFVAIWNVEAWDGKLWATNSDESFRIFDLCGNGTPTATPGATATPSLTATATPSPTATPSVTETLTAIGSETPSPSGTQSLTATFSHTPTSTLTPVETSTPTPTSTGFITPEPTATPTNTLTPTETETPLPSVTPTPTATVTPLLSPTASPVPVPGQSSRVLAVAGSPNPNPLALHVELQGAALGVRFEVYSASNTLILSWQEGVLPAGWNRRPAPEGLRTLPNGRYSLQARAKGEDGVWSPGVSTNLFILH